MYCVGAMLFVPAPRAARDALKQDDKARDAPRQS
ncbi:hypothetical protein XOCgx_0111 [Xanthomonas oryzae pv. oryzicola]|nr:hypothetical protein XOCgx_0111 [Xanthomonas oryzae pv. oryzicola]